MQFLGRLHKTSCYFELVAFWKGRTLPVAFKQGSSILTNKTFSPPKQGVTARCRQAPPTTTQKRHLPPFVPCPRKRTGHAHRPPTTVFSFISSNLACSGFAQGDFESPGRSPVYNHLDKTHVFIRLMKTQFFNLLYSLVRHLIPLRPED